MNREEFAWTVFNGADGSLPVQWVRAAIRQFAEQQEPLEANLHACHQRARELAAAAAREAPPPSMTAFVSLPTTLGVEMTHRGLLGVLRPWAEDLRAALFGKRSAPFASTDEVEEWLADQEPAHFGEAGAKTLPYAPPRRARQLIRVAAPDGTELADVRVGRAEGAGAEQHGGRSALVPPGSIGWRLADEAERMSVACGVPPADLVQYVLTGRPPKVRPPQVWIRFRPHHPALVSPVLGRLFGTQVVIELEEIDVTADVFRALALALRKALGRMGRKAFTEDDRVLVEIVERLSRTSASGQIDWREVSEQFARATRDKVKISPKALQMRHRRLRVRLGTRGAGSPHPPARGLPPKKR